METTQHPSPAPVILDSVPMRRVFKYEKEDGEVIELPDPNPNMLPRDVVKFYAGTYPELTNSTVDKPEMEGNDMIFTIGTSVGTKG